MTDNNKPEWFEITENDRPAVPAKASKSLPLAAVLAAALIIGMGAVVAQTQEEPPANATETTQVQTSAAEPTSTSSASTTQTASQSTTPTVKVENQPSTQPSATASGLQNPAIAKLPTKGGDDEGEHEGREHHGDRESHSEGDDD